MRREGGGTVWSAYRNVSIKGVPYPMRAKPKWDMNPECGYEP